MKDKEQKYIIKYRFHESTEIKYIKVNAKSKYEAIGFLVNMYQDKFIKVLNVEGEGQ